MPILKRKVVLTPSMMIEKAVGVVDNAVSMFKQAILEIDKANEMLNQSKIQSQEKIDALELELVNTQHVKNEAEAKINTHLELRGKLSQFVQ